MDSWSRMYLKLIVAMAATSIAVVSNAEAAVVVSTPSPIYAVNEYGAGPAKPLFATVRSGNAGGQFGGIGYRVQGSGPWTRCRVSTDSSDVPIFVPFGFGASASEGIHYLEVADDYDEIWAAHNFPGSAYDEAHESCQDPYETPRGEVLSIPFIVDRSDPLVSEFTSRRVAPSTYEVCATASDPYSGLRSISLSTPGRGPKEIPFTGQKSGTACETFEWTGQDTGYVSAFVQDWAYNSGSDFTTVDISNRPDGNGSNTARPFRLKVTRKKISQRNRSIRLWFQSNLSGVMFRCGFAGYRLVRCSSPFLFYRLDARNRIVIQGTDRRGRVRTIRVFVRIN